MFDECIFYSKRVTVKNLWGGGGGGSLIPLGWARVKVLGVIAIK